MVRRNCYCNEEDSRSGQQLCSPTCSKHSFRAVLPYSEADRAVLNTPESCILFHLKSLRPVASQYSISSLPFPCLEMYSVVSGANILSFVGDTVHNFEEGPPVDPNFFDPSQSRKAGS